ncbi:unnamed protein product [Sphagnum jensenii]|jgi:hypothetical protein|uniref:Uncharacterized protein n=1 Tax=Sphagnum jensenii TaxID=128206 RepID=A0ABP0XJH9_9BRYO
MEHTSSDGANQVDAAVPGGRTSKPLKPVWEVPRVRWIRNQADDQRVPVLKDQIVPVYSLSCVEKKMACCCGLPKRIRGMVSSRRGKHGKTPMNCSSISINCVSIGINSAHRSVVRQKRWVKFLHAWKLRNQCCQKKGGQSSSSVKQLSADVGQCIARSPECDFNPTGSAVPVFKITLGTQE